MDLPFDIDSANEYSKEIKSDEISLYEELIDLQRSEISLLYERISLLREILKSNSYDTF